MIELLEYRKQLMDRLEKAAKEFSAACLAVKDPFAPLEAGGWNVHQIAVHTRDVNNLVYGLRARRTLEEANPLFPNFDGDAYMAAHYDSKESLRGVLDELVSSIQTLLKTLRGMSAEGWSRESRHETQGSGLTLQTWVERGLSHLEEHLAAVKNTVQ
ncbi:MAG: DinB family protein [Chloroflexi bacterium]|nr:DinB family protein [Chloroflexota bacterium]